MASSTDVRAWAREQGHDIKERGALPQHIQDAYAEAHQPAPAKTVQGVLLDSSTHPYPDDPAMGVTAADFPPEDDYPDAPAGGGGTDTVVDAPPESAPRGRGRRGAERKPRTVKPAAPAGGIRERIFGGKSGAGKPKPKAGPRQSLSDWAEEAWSDFAWLAQPVPPLARMLELQAPYAGVVFDDQVAGTPIDPLLQKAAKYSGMMRGLNGLIGPPVYVGMICATGQRVQVGQTATGEPVLDFDGRTKMLFGGLRYSLLQMTKIAEVNAEEIQARTEASVVRTRAVDAMIDSIFGFSDAGEAGPVRPAEPAYATAPPAGANGYTYPPPPTMDGTGADPGRL